jgi:AcrR family transcriptional regulator
VTRIAVEPTSPAGRSARREAICDAVFELLGEVGYDQMSMDAVAARARASKATIYRAWPHKPGLVIDAVLHRLGGAGQPPDTGTLRGDLLALASGACQVASSPDGAVVAGLISAAARDTELSRTIHECTYQAKHTVFETIVGRAVQRGEVPAGTDPELLHEVLHAMVLSRLVRADGSLDADFVVHVVDDVLLPVLSRNRAPVG